MEDFWKKASDTAKETLDIAAEAAEQAAAIAAEKLGELKVTATEKFNELSEKAEAMAAAAKVEAAEKFAEAQAAKEKIAAHGGDALDYISEKAKAMVDNVQEGASDLAEEGKDFWQKAKDYVSDSDKPKTEEPKSDTPA